MLGCGLSGLSRWRLQEVGESLRFGRGSWRGLGLYMYSNCPHGVWDPDLLSAEHEPEFSPGVRLQPSRTIGAIG